MQGKLIGDYYSPLISNLWRLKVRSVVIPESIWRLQNIAGVKLKCDSDAIVRHSHVHNQLPPNSAHIQLRLIATSCTWQS